MIVNKKHEIPDIEVISDDKHKDRLEVYVKKDDVMFKCFIDGTGNTFKIPTTLLMQTIYGKDKGKSKSKVEDVVEKMTKEIGKILK